MFAWHNALANVLKWVYTYHCIFIIYFIVPNIRNWLSHTKKTVQWCKLFS